MIIGRIYQILLFALAHRIKRIIMLMIQATIWVLLVVRLQPIGNNKT